MQHKMDGMRSYQLYLLSRMRAQETVLVALSQLAATPKEMEIAAREICSAGVETPGHRTDLYKMLLAEPWAIEPDEDINDSSPFIGSKSLRFRLPLWPEFDFLVHEHPSGYAWNTGFVRARGRTMPPLLKVAALQPWCYVAEELELLFGAPHLEDGWNNWEDLSFVVPQGRLLARFDFRLLQTVEVTKS